MSRAQTVFRTQLDERGEPPDADWLKNGRSDVSGWSRQGSPAGARNERGMAQNQRPQPKPGGPFSTVPLRWWLAFLVVLTVWNLIVGLRQQVRTVVVIPYTVFLTQVRAGNVSEVDVAGNQIRGSFAKPYTAVAPASSPAPSPAPSPGNYTTFETTR
jgi:hypothetical protein